MKKTYDARLSNFSILITVVINLLIISIICASLLGNNFLNQPAGSIKYIILLLAAIIFLFAYLLHPVKYIIENNHLKIVRLIFTISIPVKDILEIKETSYGVLHIPIRLFGSGGFWGYFGIFYSASYGAINMQAANLKEMVFISTKKKKFVISPENSQEFIDTLNNLRIK